MIVFDIDTDFFMNKKIGPEAGLGARRLKWNDQIEEWISLEQFIGRFNSAFTLDVKFDCVEEHQEVLKHWLSYIKAGSLTIPFTIVHFDAHSDLYLGRREDDYFNLLSFEQALDDPLKLEELAEEDNFLWWAIRFGWTDRILWVKPPCCKLFFLGQKEFAPQFRPDSFSYEEPFVCKRFGKSWTLSLHSLDQLHFSDHSVNFVSLAHSAKYVPEKADKIFNQFKKSFVEPQNITV